VGAETNLKHAVTAERKAKERWEDMYDAMADEIRAANADGLSYDRIAVISGRSKSQVQRICGA
jgi:hypothetical protein